MGDFSNEGYLAYISELVNNKATNLACEEMSRYEKEHPNYLIIPEVRTIVIQRAIADIMLHLGTFHHDDSMDRNAILSQFEEWFIGEEGACRTATYGNIDMEVKKRIVPGEENLSFTERFRKQVAESRKTGSSIGLVNNLNK